MADWFSVIFYPTLTIWMACSCWSTMWRNSELESQLVLDWGPQKNPIRNWGGTAIVVAFSTWKFWDLQTDLVRAMMILIGGLLAIRTVLETIPLQGIYEDGVFLMTNSQLFSNGKFCRWSEIQNYRWEEHGQLIINSGWSPTQCHIPEDGIIDLKAVLKVKCPDADQTIQQLSHEPEASVPGDELLQESAH